MTVIILRLAGNSNFTNNFINTLNADLNPTWHFLVLLGAHHILHVSRTRVNVFIGVRALILVRSLTFVS